MEEKRFYTLTEDDYLAERLASLGLPWTAHRLASASSIPDVPRDQIILIDSSCRHIAAPPAPAWRAWAENHRIIILSSAQNDDEGLLYLESGACGYCHAAAPAATLRQVLDVVASGELWVGRSLLSRLLRSISRHHRSHPEAWIELLSARECAVAKMAANGDSNAAIAQAMNISERTVKAHLSACFTKLGVSDRLQLALKVHGLRP